MSIVNSFNNYEFIILQRGVVSRHAHYASVVSTLTNHPNSVGGKKGSVAARCTMDNIVHTSTCAASVLQLWLRNYWDTSTDTLCVVGLSASYVSGATSGSAIILLSLRQL